MTIHRFSWLCLFALTRVGWAETPLEAIHSLEPYFTTPHTRWAKPAADGPARVLFLLQKGSNANALPLRDAIELMQRFDIEGTAVLTTADGLHGGEAGHKRLTRLLGQPVDCYVMNPESFGQVPKESRDTILARVAGGAGLLFLSRPDEGSPAGATPLEPTPALLAGITAEYLALEQGRVVIFAHPNGLNLYSPTREQAILGVDLLRDEHYERLGRALLSAARREPQGRLSVSMPDDTIGRAQLADHAIVVKVEGIADPGAWRIKARFRDASSAAQPFEIAERRSAAGDAWRFDIPDLPAGAHRFDVIAESDRGIECWASRALTITAQERVGDVAIDSQWGIPGTPIEGRLTVETEKSKTRAIRIDVIDPHGRAVARQEIANPGAEVRFSLPTTAATPGYVAVRAALRSDRGTIARAYSPAYTIPRARHDRWHYIIWGKLYAHDNLDIAEYLLASSGVTSRMETGGVAWWYMLRKGMNFSPLVASGTYRPPDTGPQYPVCAPDGILQGADGCWNDEPAVSARLEDYVKKQSDFRRAGVLVYDMGDEQATRGSCLYASCWNVYRTYLKDQYGADIDALNASWGTSFAQFEEIEPHIDETAIPWVSEPGRTGWIKSYANNAMSNVGPTNGSTAWDRSMRSYPRWYDRRSFQFWNFANYVRRYTEAVQRVDPGALCGVEGTFEDLDQDIDTIVQGMGYWGPYSWRNGSMPNEVIRCVTPRGYRHGNFIGMTNFWYSFMRGANTVAKWRVDNLIDQQMGLVPPYRHMTESARIVFDGLGTLLNVHERTRMLHDGVVMLHSFPSFQAIKLEAGPTYGLAKARDEEGGWNPPEADRHKRSHKAWHRTIRSSGLQFDYVSDRQILRGEFDPSPYEVMILSQCESIGPQEQQVIRDFVAGGGTVIADVRPGLYGARCKPVKRGVLDDLFGVRHIGNVDAVAVPGRITATIGDRPYAVEALELHVNPAVELAGGRALGRAGDTPICIVKDVGDGRAILLNFTMWSYPNTALHDESEEAAAFVKALFESAGIDWPLRMMDDSGKPHRNIEVMRWRTGKGVEVAALYGPDRDTWPDTSPPQVPRPFENLGTSVPLTVSLPYVKYVYEMRSGRHAGLTDEFATGVRPWWATLLVLSDRELNSPQLSAVNHAVSRGTTLELNAVIPGSSGVRALKLRATRPDGVEAPWFARSVMVEDGGARIQLPIAYNEAPGEWTVTVTDLFTSQDATASFLVE